MARPCQVIETSPQTLSLGNFRKPTANLPQTYRKHPPISLPGNHARPREAGRIHAWASHPPNAIWKLRRSQAGARQ